MNRFRYDKHGRRRGEATTDRASARIAKYAKGLVEKSDRRQRGKPQTQVGK